MVYPERIVKQPPINVEERIDRLVGRRTKTPDALSTATSTIAGSIAWREAFAGCVFHAACIVSKPMRKRTNGYGG